MNAFLKRIHSLDDDELLGISEAIDRELERRLEFCRHDFGIGSPASHCAWAELSSQDWIGRTADSGRRAPRYLPSRAA